MGVLILSGSPEDFGKMIADEAEKWSKAVKLANISADWFDLDGFRVE